MSRDTQPSPPRDPEADDWAPQSEFEEYRLLKPLGRGGTGQVYLAHDTLLDRPVAVKFLRALDARSLHRFLVEARAVARVQHPHVVTLHRVGRLGNRPYLVTEFIRGQSLEKLDKPIPWRRALEFGVALARGLAAAHRQRVLHRDVKPANVVLSEAGEVKLLDFGLAKLLDVSEGGAAARPVPTGGAGSWALSEPGAAHATHFALIGTPSYMSPEAWRGEPVDARADLYSLGAVLYELCSGRCPFGGLPVRQLAEAVMTKQPPPLVEVAPGVNPGLAAIVDRCLAREQRDRFPDAEALIDALEALRQPAPGAPPEGNPYRGLQAFEAKHRALFFGRDRAVRSLLERLRTEPFVLVSGDSGVGKSSLCLAGLLPRLLEGAWEDGRTWTLARLSPGRRPLEALAAALGSALGHDEAGSHALVGADPDELRRAVRRALGSGRGLLVFIDQLEELISMSPAEEAERVARALGELASAGPAVRLVATARSDFLTRLAGLPGLGAQVPRSLELLGPLNREELREAIVGPARVFGVRFESEALVEHLVGSTAAAEGGLPLLQFALMELWERRETQRGVLTASALDSLGGVAGALARHADGVVEHLLPAERAVARRLLTRLVSAEGTRVQRTGEELLALEPEGKAPLEALVRGRLLAVRETEAGTTYELAHEALVRSWSSLARWLDEEGQTRDIRERLERAASEWQRLSRSPEALWGTRQLAEALPLRRGVLGPREAAFLATSEAAVRRARWLRWGLPAGFLVVLCAVYGGLRAKGALESRRAISEQLRSARVAIIEAGALEARLEAKRQEAFHLFDQRRRKDAETAWAQALALVPEVEHSVGTASEELEKAIALGSSDPDVQDTFAAFLYQRALAAEGEGRAGLRDQLLQRLRLYDRKDELWRRWSAPADLTLLTEPAGAEVRLEAGGGGKGIRSIGRSPLHHLALEPGSWILELRAAGRAPVRYPLVLRRGESRSLRIRLPRTGEVPEGFVYVPAGRSFFGSSEEESVREFFNSAPLHEVETDAFLVAQHETTFGDWLEFLDALPPEERARRTPHAGSWGLQGYLELVRRGRAWTLRFQPARVLHEVAAGERLHYPDRERRSVQDWLRLPVSGISLEDANAYVAWLRRTRRVPLARLCTEHEWERAARGADAREFPHGRRLEPGDANFDRTYGKRPSAFGPDEVGSHPSSRSPFGLDDTSGNVWEWVRSSLAEGEAVARGGGYYFASSSCRLTNRELPEPSLRDSGVGLRLCATPPPVQ